MGLILTRTQNARSGSNLDKWEIRPSRYGALDAFKTDSARPGGILTPELIEKARMSIGSTFETPVIDYDGTISIGSARSVTVADSELTSNMQTITFVLYTWGFTQVPGLFHNNEIGYEEDFAKKYSLYAHKVASTVDTACLSALNTGKSQVDGTLLNKYTRDGNDVVVATTALQDEILGDTNVMMEENDYFANDGNIMMVANAGFNSRIRLLAESGLYNSENKQLQYSDKTWHFTNRLANATSPDHKATAYAINPGSLGLLSRVGREALVNRQTELSYKWETINMPILDLDIEAMYYQSVGDFNALGGAATADHTAAFKEHWGFAAEIAYLTPYNSDITTLAAPIIKTAISVA